MAKKHETKLPEEGAIVWIPCDVRAGMFPHERQISIEVPGKVAISGFVPVEDVRGEPGSKGEVRAIVVSPTEDTVRLLFHGELLSATNPATVPSRLVAAARAG